ncbi:hypothetical protein [Methanonatronarchaeum sp. AMET-Sl]|uniref:hypothetical protein n=1 Tax=Methanonatronarchaeum sp. AMET-Sl TaxID=3037654 RepID=UPI00244DE1BA|nr:hypothetical protein [Methanonatronarchaeum sp. AMET-Sl]WGI16951.1 hypothetical protein QEN48_05475 [Methanonatronarchaeum sp. AMET-Sl]
MEATLIVVYRPKQLLTTTILLILFLNLITGVASASHTEETIESSLNDKIQEIGKEIIYDCIRVMTNPIDIPGTDLQIGMGWDWIRTFLSIGDLNETAEYNSAIIYDYALHMNRDESTFLTITENHLKDTENIVWSKIKIQVAQDLSNDVSLSAAKANTTKIVSDHYSGIQQNLDMQLNSQIKTLLHLKNLNNQSNTAIEKPFHAEFKYKYSSWQDGSTQTDTRTHDQIKTYNNTVTLLNGTNITVTDLEPKEVSSVPNNHGTKLFELITYSDQPVMDGAAECIESSIKASSPHGTQSIVIDNCKWNNLQQKLIDRHDMMVDNADKYITEVYDLYTKGEINQTELIDPYILAGQLNTQYNQTGYYGYAAAELTLLGINTTLHERFEIQIKQSPHLQTNKSITGMLFTNYDFNGTKTINNGSTYNTTNWTDDSLLYILNNDGIQLLQDTTFKVTKIIDIDGNHINEVTFQCYNHQNIEPNKLNEDLKEIQEMYNEILDINQSSIYPPPTQTNYWIIITTILIAILILRR